MSLGRQESWPASTGGHTVVEQRRWPRPRSGKLATTASGRRTATLPARRGRPGQPQPLLEQQPASESAVCLTRRPASPVPPLAVGEEHPAGNGRTAMVKQTMQSTVSVSLATIRSACTNSLPRQRVHATPHASAAACHPFTPGTPPVEPERYPSRRRS